jgi:O-antigen/teichoic acid export membrane protein
MYEKDHFVTAEVNEQNPDRRGTAEPPTLGHRVSRALSWSVLAQLVIRAGVFGMGVVLARLLTPRDFGEFAIALIAVSVVMTINELGVIPAIVRWTGDIKEATTTATTIAVGNSFLLYAVVFVSAPWFADAMDAPDATWLARVLCLTIIVDGLIAIPLAQLARELRQGAQTSAEIVGMVVMVAMSIGMAAAGAGASSMAWGRVAGSAVTGVIMIACAPFLGRPRFDWPVARRLLKFGVPLALSMLLAEAVLNVDYIVVGSVLSVSTLGIYLLAFNLSSWPVSIVGTAIARVSFAGFSHLAHDAARLVTGFLRSIGIAASAVIPLVVLVAVGAPEIVRIVYGSEWLDAVVAVRFLIVLGGLRVLFELATELIAVDDRPGITLVIRVGWFVALVPALVVGARAGGIEGVGIAHLLVAGVLVVPWTVLELKRSGVRPMGLARTLARPVLAGIAALVVTELAREPLSGDFMRLAVSSLAGGAVYLAVLLPRNAQLAWLLQQLKGERAESVA